MKEVLKKGMVNNENIMHENPLIRGTDEKVLLPYQEKVNRMR